MNNQTFNAPVYGGVNTTESGDITTTTNIGMDDTNKILEMIATLKELVKSENELPKEDTKNVCDDLDIIEEQLNMPTQNKRRIDKAVKGVKEFISNLPATITNGTAIVNSFQQFIDSIQNF